MIAIQTLRAAVEPLSWLTIQSDSGQPCLMTTEHGQNDWRRLAEALVARRKELGYPKRLPFARAHGLTHDRTLSDLENARRTSFEAATLAQVEQMYGWVTGSIESILQGSVPVPTAESVGTSPDTSGVLLSVPADATEGMTPAERQEAIAAATATFLRRAREIRRRLDDDPGSG